MAPLIRPNAVVLDVGCGDGLLTQSILDLRPDLIVGGFDVHVRPRTHVRVRHFDGRTLPHGNESVDVVILADVLHHAEDPIRLLFETARVARHTIIIKDHVQKDWIDRQALRFMDWAIGTPRAARTFGHYWTAGEWTLALQRVGIPIESWNTSLGLYPWPASVLFDRSLHFVARLGAGSFLRRT
jgi:SAM-dependent methyltransferase